MEVGVSNKKYFYYIGIGNRKSKTFFVDALYGKLLFMNVGELSEGFDRG